MAKRSPIDQLDVAVEAIVGDIDAPLPRVDSRLTALLKLAADLRDLPSESFKARLKAELISPRPQPPAPSRSQRRAATPQARRSKRPLTSRVRPIPEGYHSATPCLVVKDGPTALDFYKKVFDATELTRLEGPGGQLMHAEFKIGDSRIALAGEEGDYNLSPQTVGGTPVIVSLYVEDVDAVANRAIAAGAKMIFPVADQFYGDRSGRFADPFGHVWIVATHKEDVSQEEMRRRAETYSDQQIGDNGHEKEVDAAVRPLREGFHTVTPGLRVEGTHRMIDFLKRVFGGEEIFRAAEPGGPIHHAEVRIGDSIVEMGEPHGEFGPMPTSLHLYVNNVDSVYRLALDAGATSIEEPADQDYGDRVAGVKDPFGNNWYIATHRAEAAPLPAGLHNLTPHLHAKGATKLIDFLKKAFGAKEVIRVRGPRRTIAHAKVKIGDSVFGMGDAHGPYQPMPGGFHLFVDDTDAVYKRALRAGARSIYKPMDQDYGVREAGVRDPFGNHWYIAHPNKNDSPYVREPKAGVSREKEPPLNPIPASAYRAEPHLVVRSAAKLMDFLREAFGAEETSRDLTPEGTIAHLAARIGDSVITAGDATSEYQPMPTALHLYVPDAEAVYRRALAAGATSTQEPTDQDYGDREAGVKDPFGNNWYVATHKGATYIPENLGSLTPYLHPKGADKLIDYLKRAFGAEEMFRAQPPGDVVHHAKIRIGESVVEMGEAHAPYGPMPTIFHLYVDHTDSAYRRAIEAGGISLSEPANRPWGMRNAGVQDPAGNQWWINQPLTKAKAEPENAAINIASIPAGFHALTPFLTVPDVRRMIDFVKSAFDAEELSYGRGGDPPHDHAEVRIGDSIMMMGEPVGEFGASQASIYVYVADADAVYQRALKAGGVSVREPQNKPYGNREASVKDPFGNIWFVATRKKT
jgi:PhnB protein